MVHVTKGMAGTKVTRARHVILAAVVCGGGSVLLLFVRSRAVFLLPPVALINPHWTLPALDVTPTQESYTIRTQGCTIPALHPFDDSIKLFIDNKNLPKPCLNANLSLLDSNHTHIWIKTENLKKFNLPHDSNISCCYKAFYRPSAISDINAIDIDDRVEYFPCVDFTHSIEVMNEFVKVSCDYEDRNVYEQFYAFPTKKPFIANVDDIVTEIPPNRNAYNVLVMGIDAVSRLNFHRTMPKTVAFLEQKGAIELLGYNKVGDNTFPNLTPMLLGIKDTDLKKTCWPNMRTTFDNCPFIWEWYKDAGYYTALGEDSATLGTFNFEKIGFSNTPTDYYLRTFMHEAETRVGNNKDFNAYLCMGDKFFFQVLLDYISSLFRVLGSSKLFGFFWEVSMSHDYLNYPSAMDNSYDSFFQTLDNSGFLDDTVIFLLSDHGIRWGKIRFTKQGRLEERLPLVYILVPPTFRSDYNLAYSNLKSNGRRLTTPYDIHSTLLDLINLNDLTDEKLRMRQANNNDVGKSLFMPVPSNRTCKSAGIDDHWCTCHKSETLSTTSDDAREASLYLVKHLNSLVSEYRQCSKLFLKEVVEVREMIAGCMREDDKEEWREFLAVVVVKPGGGVFEGTLRYDGYRWSVLGSVSRLNLYGTQSRCLHHYQLKLYCYCH